MGFKMKKPSMTQGTKGHREAIKNIKLNRSMDKTSLPDGRPGSSPFQKTGSPAKYGDHEEWKTHEDSSGDVKKHKHSDENTTVYDYDIPNKHYPKSDKRKETADKTSPAKDIDDRITRLTERKAAKTKRQSDRATDKAARLTERADVKTAKAGVAEAKGKFVKRGRKLAKAEKLRTKAAHYTPPVDEGKTEKVSEDATKEIVKKVEPKEEPTPKASLTTGTRAEKSSARAAYKGKESLPSYKSSYEKVKDKYEDKGGYDQYVKDAEAWWAKQESPTKHAVKAAGGFGVPHRRKYGKGHTEHNVKLTKEQRGDARRDVLGWDNPNKPYKRSPAKNYKNPQDYKVFNFGNKPTPVKNKKKY